MAKRKEPQIPDAILDQLLSGTAASDLAPYLSSFMSRVCSPFAPMRGGLQRLLV